MKKYTINNNTISIPEAWNEISYNQYFALIENKTDDNLVYISILTGLSPDEWLKSKDVATYEDVINNLSWLNELPDISNIPYPKNIVLNGNTLKIPERLDYHTVAQYKDIQNKVQQFAESAEVEASTIALMTIYPDMVAIYLQPQIDGEYSYSKAMELVPLVKNLKLYDIASIANFFLRKSIESKIGTMNKLNTPVDRPIQKNKWQGLKTLLKGGDSTQS